MTYRRSVSLFAAFATIGLSLTPAVAQQVLPSGTKLDLELSVEWPNEVSGVARTEYGFYVVGDATPRNYYTWPGGIAHEMGGEDGQCICDAEAIDVGHGPNGEKITLVLSEDTATVYGYVSQLFAISLPTDFAEQRGRGAEGLSVKWENGQWELVVLWEGGFFDEPEGCECKSASSVAATAGTESQPQDARIMRYSISADGKRVKQQGAPISLPTSTLLEGLETHERFRATDVAWDGEQLLVLLGSMPPPGYVVDHKYQFTWIQGFYQDGSLAKRRRIRLEHALGTYRDHKNWEALDAYLDEETNTMKLVLGYDAPGSSKLVVFPPIFE